MELITKLENKYTRTQLHNFCKDKNVEKYMFKTTET
jgi:hypothetical protein